MLNISLTSMSSADSILGFVCAMIGDDTAPLESLSGITQIEFLSVLKAGKASADKPQPP